MSRPKGSKNKPKLKEQIVKSILREDKPKRKNKETKTSPVIVHIDHSSVIKNKDIKAKIEDLKSDKPKRTRRKKSEIEAEKKLEEQNSVILHKSKTQKSLKSEFKKLDNGQVLFKYGQYTVNKIDSNNLAAYLVNGDKSVFLGYYPLNASGFREITTMIATRLITKVDDSSWKGLVSSNEVLKALDLFRVFLDTNFKS